MLGDGEGRGLPPILVALLLACGACGAQAGPVALTEADAAAPRRVAVGEPFEVALEAQLGTGFSWRAEPSPGLVQLGEPSGGKADRPGGAESQHFRFKATAAGSHRLAFTYGQPWSGGQKGRSLAFTIEAK